MAVAAFVALLAMPEASEPAPDPMASRIGVASAGAISVRVFAKSRQSPTPAPAVGEVRADQHVTETLPPSAVEPATGSIWAEGAEFAPPES